MPPQLGGEIRQGSTVGSQDRTRVTRSVTLRPRKRNGLRLDRWAARRKGASRTDSVSAFGESGGMKKRLLITGLVLVALVLALYGVIVGTGGR